MNRPTLTRRRLLWGLPVLLLTVLALVRCQHGDDLPALEDAVVDRGDITRSVAANGQLNPVTLVSVGTQVSGIVTAYTADFNDRVEAGQVLMQLDDSLLRAQLRQSEAGLAAARSALDLAQAGWRRVQPLAGDGFVSQQELDQARQTLADARARVAQAEAQVSRDRVNLGYAVIRSPVSGVVVSRAVDVGQTVAASFQTPELYKIARDLREMQINAYFTESDIGTVRVDQPVRFRVDAYPEQSFEGRVKQIRLNPKTEQNVVTYDVVIGVDNPDQKLLPGMTAYVSIATETRRDVLRVPTAALRFRPPEGVAKLAGAATEKAADNAGKRSRRGAGSGAGAQRGTVWILDADRLRAITVMVGLGDRQYSEVLSGELREGSRVIVGLAGDDVAAAQKGLSFRMGR